MPKCPLCQTEFEPVIRGGLEKRFCSAKCRQDYHTLLHTIGGAVVRSLVNEGHIPIKALVDAHAAYTAGK